MLFQQNLFTFFLLFASLFSLISGGNILSGASTHGIGKLIFDIYLIDFITLGIINHVIPQLVTADILEDFLIKIMHTPEFFEEIKNRPGRIYDLIPDVLKQQLERPNADYSLFTLMMKYPKLVDFTKESLKGTGDRKYIMGYKEFQALLENAQFAEGKEFPEFAQFLVEHANEITDTLPKEEIAKMVVYSLAVLRGEEFNEELFRKILSNPLLTFDIVEMVQIVVTQLLAKNNIEGLKTVLYNSNIIEKMNSLPFKKKLEFESIMQIPMSKEARAVISPVFAFLFSGVTIPFEASRSAEGKLIFYI
jgi:hypothetical protein